ncbi:lactonase family protein [Streptomyces sp. NPDC018031]|uniref:lactonase family protein n=1 Tax=Streptomyces sp. NPDC018031 TaxID=3365033 RepID=UPI00379112A4
MSGTRDGDRTDRSGGRQAYIGSFTTGGGHGITIAAVDPATGALEPVAATGPFANPSCLTLDPGTGVLYAVSETDQGAVGAFRPGSGVLDPLGPVVPVDASGPTHLSVAGGRLLTANYTSGSVSSLAVAADGRLSGPAAVFPHHGSGPDPDRQQGPHAHQVLPDPGGRWVLSVDLGTDSLRVCALDQVTGALRGHAETALGAGSGPRHLAFHPDGATVYVVHELEPRLTVCRWEPGPGRLEPLLAVPLAMDGGTDGARPCPSVVRVAPDGRFGWAAVRGSNTILTLSFADGADKPQVTDAVDCGGSWPRDLVTDAAGRRLYVANEWSGDVTWFDVDPESGRLRRAGAVPVPAAACVVLS